MKNIIFLLFLISFTSCDTSLDNFQGAKVTHMKSHGFDKCRYECIYNEKWGYQAIFFVDSCGKYKIGDTVHLQKINP